MSIFPIRITMKCPYCGQQDKVALDTRIRVHRCEWDYTIPLVPVIEEARNLIAGKETGK